MGRGAGDRGFPRPALGLRPLRASYLSPFHAGPEGLRVHFRPVGPAPHGAQYIRKLGGIYLLSLQLK
jgi:hypothetical protein